MEVKADFRLRPRVIVAKNLVPKVEAVAEKQKTSERRRGWMA